MKIRHLTFILSILFAAFIISATFGSLSRVRAQDVPEVTQSPTAQSTEEATSEPPIIVPEQPGGTIIVGWNAFSQLIGIVLLAMAGGFVLSLGSIIIIVRSVRQNDGIKAFARYLYLSQPSEVRQKEKELIELGKELVGFGDDVTAADNPPVTTTPPNNG